MAPTTEASVKTLQRKTKAKKPSSRGPREPVEAIKARAQRIIAALRTVYPDATCALTHESPLQLLVSTILSAQCTDTRVNRVTPTLFAKYKSADDFARAKPAELEKMIQSTGFFRNKTRSIIGASKAMVERFGGSVPDTMEHLLELPGVARKTANVVLGTAFGKNEGVVVDTHIGRLAHRLKLTWRSKNDKDAVKIEQDLMEIFPRDSWTYVGHALIWHGRQVCSARRPACERCVLSEHCPSAFTFDGPPGSAKKTSLARQQAIVTGKASGKRPRR
jgi:endonuclease-3